MTDGPSWKLLNLPSSQRDSVVDDERPEATQKVHS
jgi:hypothetical protein